MEPPAPTAVTSPLRICLLGRFSVALGDVELTSLNSPSLRTLLGFLAMHEGRLARSQIAFTFWPDSTERQAFNNLRNALYRLRRALPESDRLLDADARHLGFRADAPVQVDVIAFRRALADARESLQQGDISTAEAQLEEGLSHYGGDFLEGVYDEWVLAERERLHQACLEAEEQLAHLLEQRRAYGRALRHARHLQQLDPLREPTCRLLMRLHALNADRAGALRTYDTFAKRLRRELEVEPEPATTDLYRQLADGSHSPHADAPAPKEPELVGRLSEWRRLQDAWRSAAHRRASVYLIRGEAGIGKTRTADELRAWVSKQGAAVGSARCYESEGRPAFGPVVEWLRADSFEAGVSQLDDVWRLELARLLPELRRSASEVSLPPSDRVQRRQLFEAIARGILAAGRPTLLVADDLQWSDEDTLHWLRFLIRYAPEAPLLVVATVRSEEMPGSVASLKHDLERAGRIETMSLGPLSEEETAELGRQVSRAALDEAQARRLFADTEGNPLFVVESVRAGISEKPGTASKERIPDRVRSVLSRRLMQLSPEARELALISSAVGRSFHHDVLAAAGDLSDAALADALDELFGAHILQETGDRFTYDFTHGKLREVAYAEMTPARRRHIHGRLGTALEEANAGALDAVSLQLAGHFDRAGDFEKAAAYYAAAAKAASAVGSYGDAAKLVRLALRALEGLPPAAVSPTTRLDLLIALGLALRISEGHAADSVGTVFGEADLLSEEVGDVRQKFTVRRGLWSFHLLQARYAIAEDLARDLMAIAGDEGDLLLEALVARGLTTLWMGHLEEASDYLARAMASYHIDRHGDHMHAYGQDPGVASWSLVAYVEALRGRRKAAGEKIRTALQLAEKLEHPFSRAYALQHAMLVAHAAGNAAHVDAHARALLELSRERGFAYWIGPATIGQGWAAAVLDSAADGVERIREGIRTHRAINARLSSTLWMGMLADALVRSGAVEEALQTVSEALRVVEQTGERVWEAELRRLRDELAVTS